jgi:metal-dependent amidase/aminoacylase/carboxypeptidase family protein
MAKQNGWQVQPVELSMAGDDFSYYKAMGPANALSLYMKVGTGLGQPIHDPAFKVDPAALGTHGAVFGGSTGRQVTVKKMPVSG